MAYLVFVAEIFTTVSQGKDSDSGSELPDLGLKSGFIRAPPRRAVPFSRLPTVIDVT